METRRQIQDDENTGELTQDELAEAEADDEGLAVTAVDTEGEGEQGDNEPVDIAPESVRTPVAPRPVNISIPVAPALSRTGDMLWGKEGQKKRKDELSDLFEVPKPTDNDMDTSDLFDVPDEDDHDMNFDDLVDDDLSDIVNVSTEDIMGKPRRKKPKYKRTGRPYNQPTTMGGIQ